MKLTQIGPYQVVRELARGGMGVVVVARRPGLDREVALKLMLAEQAGPRELARFQAEAQALGRLDHPGVVRVHDFGREGAHPYLVMELVQGEALDEVLAREGPLPPERAVAYALELCEAIEYCHQQGVLHRDLKPANALLDAEGRIRVTDFGLAKDAQGQSLTATGQVMGTPSYMAPEQAAGEKERFGPATDVYGLGATLYALLAGRPPFHGQSAVNLLVAVMRKPPAPLPGTLDPALRALVLRCLEKEPAARYPSAAALGEELRRFQAGALAAPRSGARVAALLGALVVGLVLVAGWFLTRPTPDRAKSTPRPSASSTTPTPSGPPAGSEAEGYRWAWRTLQRDPDHAQARELRDEGWLKHPLGQIVLPTTSNHDVQGCFLPQSRPATSPPGVLVLPVHDDDRDLWIWDWWKGEAPRKQPIAPPGLATSWREMPLLTAGGKLWLTLDAQANTLHRTKSRFEPGRACELTPLEGPKQGHFEKVAIDPARKLIVAGGVDGAAPRLYDTETGRAKDLDLDGLKVGAARYFAFSPGGELVLGTFKAEGDDSLGFLVVWDRRGRVRAHAGLALKLNRPFASEDGRTVGVSHAEGVQLYRLTNELVPTKDLSLAPFSAGRNEVRDACLFAGGRLIVVSGGSSDGDRPGGKTPGLLQLWPVEGRRNSPLRERANEGEPDELDQCRGRMQLSPDRRFLLVGSLKGVIEVYEGDADLPQVYRSP